MKKLFITLLIFFSLIGQTLSNEIAFKISKNWNQIKSMSGSFKQTDSDGNISTGKFYFLKPYQSRFEYSNKSENIITNQRLLRVVDKEGYQLDSYPISGNFLKQILSDEIHLTDEFNIKEIKLRDAVYELSVFLGEETEASRAIFYFDKNTLDLKKWEILDEFENKTVLEFTKIKKNIFISENLFAVKYR